MSIKYLITTLLFFIFAIIQNSFLPYFNIMGVVPNLIFALFFILIFFENTDEGFFHAIVAGFFLDIFLGSYFGISIISLVIVYFFQKLIFHFFEKDKNKYIILNFIIVFSLGFVLYSVLLYLFSIIFNFEFNLGWNLVVSLINNLIIGTLGFYIHEIFIKSDNSHNQLKLL